MAETTSLQSDIVDDLHSSPVHDLRPISEDPMEIDIESIEIDATNPGTLTASLRYQRRSPSIRDSWDILGRIVYPVVVCQKQDDPSTYIHVDGFGRLEQAKERGAKKIRAIVYPPLNLEQRICLRETLNAAQEPFDAASIIRDLQELARQRGLDVRNKDHIKTLIRDMPDKVRKHERDLAILARWDPGAAEKIGESYGSNAAIGMDKVKALARAIDVVGERHGDILTSLGGEMALSARLTNMYLDGKFRKGRSQQAIREVVRALKVLPENDPKIKDYLRHELDWRVLQPYGEEPAHPPDLLKACEQLTSLLLTLDADSLTDPERRALTRTRAVLNEVLGQAGE